MTMKHLRIFTSLSLELKLSGDNPQNFYVQASLQFKIKDVCKKIQISAIKSGSDYWSVKR